MTPVSRIRRVIASLKARARYRLMRMARVHVLDTYSEAAPSAQNALDIFKGEFVSAMPPERADLEAGSVRLFDDERISWLAAHVDLDGADVLELGPLEAGHSYMLQKLGSRRVTAVESNSRAYLKSLVVKEILGLDRVHLLYGNFVEYLREAPGRFDVCVASGVLYHMRNPIELIALIADVTDTVFLWTHYYDAAVLRQSPAVLERFSDGEPVSFGALEYAVHRYNYAAGALGSAKFCGGSSTYSHWMERDDILACLRHHGFTTIDVAFDHADHQNGPSFAVLARRG